MSLSTYIDRLLFFVSQWAGVTLPRIVAALAGIAVCVWCVEALWSRRIRPVMGLPMGIAALLLVSMALNTGVLHWLVATSYLTRIRLLMALLSLVVLIVTFEAIRRSHLQERYALMWMVTGLLVLLCSAFPALLAFITVVLNVPYVTAVVILVFTFLVLVAFHFSLSLSDLHDDRSRLAQRCATMEARLRALEAQLDMAIPHQILAGADEDPCRARAAGLETSAASVPRGRGTSVGAPLIIGLAVVFVVLTGLLAPRAMIGDEVTHYYMLVEQARTLPAPNYFAFIPNGWGAPEMRCYPHPNAWHYMGACLYRLTGGSFTAIQFYQAFFLLQLLVVGYRLAWSRGGVESRSALLYVLVLATIPMSLIFSVAFYQDVPMAAQALTAFYLLSRRRFLWSALFMCLAIGMKVTGAAFVPPYLFLMGYGLWKSHREQSASWSGWRISLVGGLCVALLAGTLLATAWSLKRYVGAGYYPMDQMRSSVARIMPERVPPASSSVSPEASKVRQEKAREKAIIANHPGDLRLPVNYFIYGGALLWIVVGLGLSAKAWRRKKESAAPAPSGAWLWCAGGFYTVVTAYQLSSTPDARFFLPGLVLMLLPMAEWAVLWPRSRAILAVLSAIAIFQGGTVLLKTHHLREVSPALKEAIQFLRNSPPEHNRVFMYPEGNYRLFPSAHEWYLGYRLRDFWLGSNDKRIALCHHFKVGAIVIKKHLIRPVDDDITDLGCYPDFFVRDLAGDKRFERLFENDAVIIYRVPPLIAGSPL